MPFKLNQFLWLLCFGILIFFILLLNLWFGRCDEQGTWLDLEVKQQGLLPVKIQLNWSHLGMRLLKLIWHVLRLNQPSSNSVGDSLDQLLLSLLLVIVYGKNVVTFWLLVKDAKHNSSQVSNVNCWNKVVSLADKWKSNWILEPGLLEMRVEDSFSFSVEDTGRDDISLDVFLLEV